MGIVTPPSKVLVTGANGFVGVWVVRLLLEQGYYVRGTVRSEQKATYLKVRFAKYDDKLEIVVIPDMLVATAFDESVKGVQGILHMAAVVSLGGTYESEFSYNGLRHSLTALSAIVKPSIVMTENILNSTLKYGTDVRRLTITSSAVALLQPQEPGYTYTDKDWNEYAIQEMKEKGDKSAYHIPYFAAKTMAERAAWEFLRFRAPDP
ncbi:NADP-binding protein [Dacryopinax primogenitus]|uniref:NADP-binding protein n=1 Tax=Dacryopinax primogenitus (strain DJM 731) TaxID=1858805 RepID=M5FWJ0_DACPD|nr:NADP-binding protein [Dacryopinax primogenitus]EJU00055.1 NADP-binding protein [Dacryopinax primogenitus]